MNTSYPNAQNEKAPMTFDNRLILGISKEKNNRDDYSTEV